VPLSIDHLVSQHFVLNRNWLPLENMVIPLMVFLSHIKGFDRIDEAGRKYLEFWFWASVFANRYSTSSNDVIISDSIALALIAQGKRIERRDYFTHLRSLVTDPDDLFIYTTMQVTSIKTTAPMATSARRWFARIAALNSSIVTMPILQRFQAWIPCWLGPSRPPLGTPSPARQPQPLQEERSASLAGPQSHAQRQLLDRPKLSQTAGLDRDCPTVL
jgi:hypothetical protein